MSSETTGSCVCGAVRYTVEGPYLTFQQCFCSRCRKVSGAAYASNLFSALEGVRFDAGEDLIQTFDLPEAKYWRRAFCTRCGSQVPYVTRTGKAWIVPAGGLDGDPGERPARNIFFGSRAPWYIHAHDLDTFDEMPPRS